MTDTAARDLQADEPRIPLLAGEILFDCFPDGHQVLGGAPFNVACHLAAFGQDPLFVTRLGSDESGNRALQRMEALGLRTDGVQKDGRRATGRVDICLDQGTPSFEIRPDQAFDFLDPGEALARTRGEPLAIFYHGTLAARSPAGRRAIEELTRQLKVPRFVDVNLRDPWWTRQGACALARGADWLKLNEGELKLLSGENLSANGGLRGAEPETRIVDDVKAISALQEDLKVDNLLVTAAERGSRIVATGDSEINLRLDSPPVPRLEDTVGAGDALASVMILGLLRGWTIELALRRGMHFASTICGIRGAIPDEQEFYEPFLAEWRIDAR